MAVSNSITLIKQSFTLMVGEEHVVPIKIANQIVLVVVVVAVYSCLNSLVCAMNTLNVQLEYFKKPASADLMSTRECSTY